MRARRDPTAPLPPAVRLVRALYLVGLRGPAELSDPTPVLARRFTRGGAVAPVSLIAVYRHRNARTVRRLIEALAPGDEARLWALDAVHPALAAHTRGSGPGLKLELLNRLAEGVASGDRWTLISDDDVRFTRGSTEQLLRVAGRAGLDVCQPAHDWASKVSHTHTRARVGSVVRLTRFVEGGPMVLLSPAGRAAVFPLPAALGMGWGVEAHWASVPEPLRLGIVDAVRVRHLERPGRAYDVDEQRRRERAVLEAYGLPGWEALQQTSARWLPVTSQPAWTRSP